MKSKQNIAEDKPVVITVFSVESSKMGYVFIGKDEFFTGNYHDFHTGCFGDAIFDFLATNHGWQSGRFGLADALCRYLTASGIKTEVVRKTGECARDDDSSLSSNDHKSLSKNKGLTREQYQELIIKAPESFRQKQDKIEKDKKKADAANLQDFLDKCGLVPLGLGTDSPYYVGLGEKSLSGFVLMKGGYPLSLSSLKQGAKEMSYSLTYKDFACTGSCSDIAIFKDRASAQKFARVISRPGKTYKVLPSGKILAKFYVVKKDSDEEIVCEVYKNTWLKEQTDYLDNTDIIDVWHRVNWKGIAFTSEKAAKKALIKGAKKRLADAQAEVARAKRILKAS